jgi:hypothetical protein
MGRVRLTIVEDEGAAEILCRALRAEGIACGYRRTDHAAGYSEGGASFWGMREILVDEADYLRALEIFESVEPAVDECVRCGRPLDEEGGWFRDDAGELQPYCGVCADRVFGPFR